MRKTLTVSSLAAIAGLALAGSAFAQTPPPGGAGSTGGAAATGQKLSQAECEAVWNKAAGSGSATSLTQTRAQAHVKNFGGADQNGDGQLSRTEFNQACDKGLVQSTAATGAGGGTSGAGGSGASPGAGGTQKK
jgi:hypothetical protein